MFLGVIKDSFSIVRTTKAHLVYTAPANIKNECIELFFNEFATTAKTLHQYQLYVL